MQRTLTVAQNQVAAKQNEVTVMQNEKISLKTAFLG